MGEAATTRTLRKSTSEDVISPRKEKNSATRQLKRRLSENNPSSPVNRRKNLVSREELTNCSDGSHYLLSSSSQKSPLKLSPKKKKTGGKNVSKLIKFDLLPEIIRDEDDGMVNHIGILCKSKKIIDQFQKIANSKLHILESDTLLEDDNLKFYGELADL